MATHKILLETITYVFNPPKQIKKGENICLHKGTLLGRCVDYDSGDGSHDDGTRRQEQGQSW